MPLHWPWSQVLARLSWSPECGGELTVSSGSHSTLFLFFCGIPSHNYPPPDPPALSILKAKMLFSVSGLQQNTHLFLLGRMSRAGHKIWCQVPLPKASTLTLLFLCSQELQELGIVLGTLFSRSHACEIQVLSVPYVGRMQTLDPGQRPGAGGFPSMPLLLVGSRWGWTT